MRILLLGSGAREHALAWLLWRHGHTVIAAPGNPGIAAGAECATVALDDLEAQVRLGRERAVELILVGPEAPLCGGVADLARRAGIPCFGPSSAGARIEGSKAWAKGLMRREGVRTAEFRVCASAAEVDRAVGELGDEVVVKADGLAAGKGVVVCGSGADAREAARRMFDERASGSARSRIILERRLTGQECSVLALTDGQRLVVLPVAEDHKAIFDGDRGPMTGGMGAVSPAPVAGSGFCERVRAEVLEPTLRGLRKEGIDYRGVLYAGLMVAADGTPQVLEFNCRFGDPETEPICARWTEDPAPWLLGAALGALPAGEPCFNARASVCVVMAAHGYPGKPRVGDEIHGLDEAESGGDVVVFHAGTRKDGARLVSAGGRVLAVTALGRDVGAARVRAYEAVERISFAGAQFRRDIGGRPGPGRKEL